MTKKTGLFTLAAATLLFSGCGGGSHKESITDQIKKRDIIVIFHAYPAEVCKSDELKQQIGQAASVANIVTAVEDNSVDCVTYGRDYNTCTETFVGGYPNACVVGADVAQGVTDIEADLSLAADAAFSSVQ